MASEQELEIEKHKKILEELCSTSSKNNIYSILTKVACYGFRPFMDNNTGNYCDNHNNSTAKAGLCYYSNWPICSI